MGIADYSLIGDRSSAVEIGAIKEGVIHSKFSVLWTLWPFRRGLEPRVRFWSARAINCGLRARLLMMRGDESGRRARDAFHDCLHSWHLCDPRRPHRRLCRTRTSTLTTSGQMDTAIRTFSSCTPQFPGHAILKYQLGDVQEVTLQFRSATVTAQKPWRSTNFSPNSS